MNEELKHNKTKWSKIYWDLWITIAVFILISSFCIARQMIQYRCGLALSVSRFNLLYSRGLLLPFIFLPTLGLIMILIIRLILLNKRFDGKRLLLQIALIIAAIFGPISMVLSRFDQIIPGFKEGFYENMKANADIVAIQDWLDSFDWDSFEKQKKDQLGNPLPHDSWPDAIKKLPDLPKQEVYPMKSANNNIYVRVQYGGGWALGHFWSLVVGVGADEIPLDDHFYLGTEERLELAPNAFVGYEWKR